MYQIIIGQIILHGNKQFTLINAMKQSTIAWQHKCTIRCKLQWPQNHTTWQVLIFVRDSGNLFEYLVSCWGEVSWRHLLKFRLQVIVKMYEFENICCCHYCKH